MTVATIKLHNKGLCIYLPQEAEWASITHSHSPGKKENYSFSRIKEWYNSIIIINIKND